MKAVSNDLRGLGGGLMGFEQSPGVSVRVQRRINQASRSRALDRIMIQQAAEL